MSRCLLLLPLPLKALDAGVEAIVPIK